MRRIVFTPRARFAVDSLESEKRNVVRAITRLRAFSPERPEGVARIERPHPTYVLPTTEGVIAFFRLLPAGDMEIIDLIRKEAAEMFRAEAGQPA